MTVKKRRRKQTWNIGDLFTIPLADGTYSIGRVVGYEPEALNSAVCAFYAHRVDVFPNMELNLSEDELISILFVTRDLLDSGDWQVFSHCTDEFPLIKYIDLYSLRHKEFIGVSSIGSGIIIKLMKAYYKLGIWDNFYDPNYLDSLLISADKKPKDVILK
ncbi:Imm26 family immunity protein [Hafnia sp. HMSC23F03]|uniref:Imm26 family immunity protein n=1 Tax=Hafnia sp. HMSC23F03 TaxID=1581059 RepID=UPI0008A42277|nr:Imm26 family immunity protein [Hafnia sp. HMSC23F03]OFS08307.1 hypothetical protein HMPREF3091_19235 [Hafnia sp. HMSC23F03]